MRRRGGEGKECEKESEDSSANVHDSKERGRMWPVMTI